MVPFIESSSFQTGSSDKTYLRVSDAKVQGSGKAWKIDLKKPLSASGSQTIEVELILAKVVELYPKEISQREKQLVKKRVQR